MHQKLVTVIIPTYNRGHLVVEAIKSVKAQSYSAVQIIVADDGSQDDTARRVAEFADVEYYYQENKGQSGARNLGLEHARGEYIASLDSDDIWNTDFIETAVGALERFEADFVFLNWTQTSKVGEYSSDWERSNRWRKYAGSRDGEWFVLNEETARELFLETCPAPSSALLIRRSSIVSKWNEEMHIADDWFLILEMVLMKPCRAAFTLSTHWTKRIHSSNIYDGREKLEIVKYLLIAEPLIAERFQERLTTLEKAGLRRRLAIHHFNFGRLNWQRDGFSAAALRSIRTAFSLAPVNSVFYISQLSFYNLRNRFLAAKDKYKQSREV